MKRRKVKPLLTRVTKNGYRRKVVEHSPVDSSRVHDPETGLTPHQTKQLHDALDDWLHNRRGKERKGPTLSAMRLRPALARAFDEEQERLLEVADVTRERVLLELARCGFSDPKCAFREDGTLLETNEMNEDVRRAIQSFKVEELFEGRGEDRERVGQVKEIKFWPKVPALELLARSRPIGLIGPSEIASQSIFQFVVVREDRPGGREIENTSGFLTGGNGDAHLGSS